MKKIICILSVTLLLAGCGKNYETPTPDEGLGTATFNTDLFFGSWKLYEVNSQLAMYRYSAKMTFTSTGFYILTGDLGNDYGSFIFDDRKVICTSSDGGVRTLSVGWVKVLDMYFTSKDFEIGTSFVVQRTT